jgi:hypothetical protein
MSYSAYSNATMPFSIRVDVSISIYAKQINLFLKKVAFWALCDRSKDLRCREKQSEYQTVQNVNF